MIKKYFIIVLLSLVFIFPSTLDAKKKKKKHIQNEKSQTQVTQSQPKINDKKNKIQEEEKESSMIDIEKKNFNEKLTFEPKYPKKYGIGYHFMFFNALGNPNEVNYEESEFFLVFWGFNARIDINRLFTVFPYFFATTKRDDTYRTFISTRRYMALELEGAWRNGFYKDFLELFLGLGAQVIYSKKEIIYSTASVNWQKSNKKIEYMAGPSASISTLLKLTTYVSLFTSFKYYLVNFELDTAYAARMGVMLQY